MADNENQPALGVVRAVHGDESAELIRLVSVFDDLQYVLRCCEHLVTALAAPDHGPERVDTDDALVEALWTGALVGYARCFSDESKVLTEADLAELETDDDATSFHRSTIALRDHFVSMDTNPRETVTIGAAEDDAGRPAGVAIVAMPTPTVNSATVRLVGRIAYGLSGLIDARIQSTQRRVLTAAEELPAQEFTKLPEIHLADT